MFMIELDYPGRDEGTQIARPTTGVEMPSLDAVLNAEQVLLFKSSPAVFPYPTISMNSQQTSYVEPDPKVPTRQIGSNP